MEALNALMETLSTATITALEALSNLDLKALDTSTIAEFASYFSGAISLLTSLLGGLMG